MDKFDDSNQSRIPVFVFPGTVYFNANDRDQIKQILTIYNPYDFPIRFKVLCTAPDLYTVIDPEGSIKPRNCVDLIVRVSSDIPSDSTNVLEHKFRVQIYHHLEKKVLGKRDVQAIIHFGNLPAHLALGAEASSMGGMSSSSGPQSFQQSPSGSGGIGGGGGPGGRDHHHHPLSGSTAGDSVRMGIGFLPQTNQPNYAVIFTAVVCLIGLMLPNSVEFCNNINNSNSRNNPADLSQISSWIPASFHLTLHQKLLFAYTLGLVTMVIFRP